MMLPAVSDSKDALVMFTREIIRIQSYTGREQELAACILNKLLEFDLDEAFIDGIGNVVGIINGAPRGPNIMLNGHLDIVPAGNPDNWEGFGPFDAAVDADGNIRGRGAADLKSGLAAQLYTMKLVKMLKDKGIAPKGNLIFSAVVHEEAAEMFGMEYLMTKTLPQKGLEIDFVILCEPTGLDVALGQRGKVELVVTTQGRTAHSSDPKAGVNALEKMLPVLDYIFNAMNHDAAGHRLLGGSCATVTNLICRPGSLSIIPDECEISVDRRYMPDQTIEELLSEFEALFARLRKNDPEFKATVYPRKVNERSYTGYEKEVQKYHPPWIVGEDDPYVQQALAALKKIGQNPQLKYWKFGTDGSMTAGLLKIPTMGYSGAEERYAHTAKEMISIDRLLKSLEGYFAITTQLLGMQ